MKKSKKRPDGHPGDEVHERHLAFIHANFEQLAAAAYKGYIEHGRGMLVLNDADFIDKARGRFTQYRQAYMAKGNDVFKEAGGEWPGVKEARWVAEYDPERTVLIGFVRGNGGISSYRVEGVGNGIPVMAYERQKGGTN